MKDEEIRNIIEAALFVAAKPLSLAELYSVVKPVNQIPKKRIESILKDMETHYDNHGIKVIEKLEGVYELKVKDEFLNHVEHLAPERDFSRAVVQTLSLVAFKNPIKQSEIIQLRGNRAYDHIKELEGKGFIRTEPSGHTNLVSITRKFLDYFGLKSQSQVKQYFADRGVSEESFREDGEETSAGEGSEPPEGKSPLAEEIEEQEEEPVKRKEEEQKAEEDEESREQTETKASKKEADDSEGCDVEETSSEEGAKKGKDEYVSPFADVIGEE